MKLTFALAVLILSQSCKHEDTKNFYSGEWVDAYNENIRLRIKNTGGNDFSVQYYYPRYVIDTTMITDRSYLIDTLTSPHEGETYEETYDEKRDILEGQTGSQTSYDRDHDGLIRSNNSRDVRVYLRVK